MIKDFKSKVAKDIFDGANSRQARKIPLELHEKIQRLFDQINAAQKIGTLQIPPSNHLKKLSGDWLGFWSLRVNNQWRIVFRWETGDATLVDIVDYH